MPGAKNPAIAVKKYKEPAPEIEFLSLEQIDQQLDALRGDLKLQVMVAVLIYAGLRREELLWLTHDDIDWTAGTYGLIRIRAKTIDGESWEQKTKKNRGVFISKSFACTSRSDLADFAGSVGIAGHGCGIPSFLLRHAAKNFGLRLNIASSFLGRDFWHQKVRDQLNFYRHDRSYRVCRLTVRTMKELTKFFRPLFVLNKHDDAVKARGDQRIRL